MAKKTTTKPAAKTASKTKIVGEVEYGVCNDDRCLPPAKIAFEIALQ